jgi:hypothetical protein
VKYLQDISFFQLILTEKTDFKYLDCATPGFVIFHLSLNRKQNLCEET